MLSYDVFKQLDMRIAEVVEVKEHPNADRLYLLKIFLGEEERQIVAGLKTGYSQEDLVGRKIVVLANLEPAEIRGQRSEGMLLAANAEEGPVLIVPDVDIPAGIPIK